MTFPVPADVGMVAVPPELTAKVMSCPPLGEHVAPHATGADPLAPPVELTSGTGAPPLAEI